MCRIFRDAQTEPHSTRLELNVPHHNPSAHIQLESSWRCGIKLLLYTFSSTRAQCGALKSVCSHSARLELNVWSWFFVHIQLESSWMLVEGIWNHTFSSSRAKWLLVIADNPFLLKQCIPYSARIDLNISLVRCFEYKLGVMICDVRNVNSLFIDQFDISVCFEKSPIS